MKVTPHTVKEILFDKTCLSQKSVLLMSQVTHMDDQSIDEKIKELERAEELEKQEKQEKQRNPVEAVRNSQSCCTVL